MIVRARTEINEKLICELLKGDNTSLNYSSSFFFFNSGSSSLHFLLQIIGKGKRIGVQVYTCSTVLETIIEAGCTPVFLDIDPNYYTTTINYVKGRINEMDILLLTHLFGIPNPDYLEIKQLCHENHVELIDDLCQTFHAKIGSYLLEELSDNYFYSFFYDKPISSVSGGLLKISKKYKTEAYNMYKSLPKENNEAGCKNLKVLLLMHKLLDSQIYTKEFRNGKMWRYLLEKWPMYASIKLLNMFVNSKWIGILDRFIKVKEKNFLLRMSDVEIVYVQSMMNSFQNNNQKCIDFLKNNNLDLPIYLTNKSICCSFSKRIILDVDVVAENVQIGLYNWKHLICENDDYDKYPNAVSVIKSHINIPCWMEKPIFVHVNRK